MVVTATSPLAIEGVVALGSDIQVIDAHARRVIAAVQNE
jgi:hypothetical protein